MKNNLDDMNTESTISTVSQENLQENKPIKLSALELNNIKLDPKHTILSPKYLEKLEWMKSGHIEENIIYVWIQSNWNFYLYNLVVFYLYSTINLSFVWGRLMAAFYLGLGQVLYYCQKLFLINQGIYKMTPYY